MSIVDMLRDIAHESALNKAEKTSLHRIAKEVEQLLQKVYAQEQKISKGK